MGKKLRLPIVPGNGAPSAIKFAVFVYWLSFFLFLIRLSLMASFMPADTPVFVQFAVPGVLAAIFLFEAFSLTQLCVSKRWARNVVLLSTALAVASAVYHLLSPGPDSYNRDIGSLVSVAAEAAAGLLLLSNKSAAWFRGKQ